MDPIMLSLLCLDFHVRSARIAARAARLAVVSATVDRVVREYVADLDQLELAL